MLRSRTVVLSCTRILAILGSAVLLSSPLPAQDSYPHSAESETLGISVYLVPDKGNFLDAWAGPTPPRFDYMSTATLGQSFALVVIYWGGGADDLGSCQLFMDLRIRQDDGKVIGEGAEVPVCVGHAPPPEGALGLGDVVVDLAAGGSAGTIFIETSFIDRVNGSELSIEVPLEVRK